MRAGELDRRIRIETAVTTPNELNEPIETWIALASVRARKTDVSDRERLASAEVSAEITTRFLIRWGAAVSAVTPKDRVICEGKTYNIFAVKEVGRRRGIEISAAGRADQVKFRVSVSGLRELDRALGELPKATARNVLKRVLNKAGQPVKNTAKALSPKDKGELEGSIEVGWKISNKVGNAEFSAAMKAGLGKEAAVKALRGARRAAKGQGSFAEAFIGPTKAKSKKDGIKRIVQEFGSSKQPGQPYLRPAWDGKKGEVLQIIKNDLGDEIIRTAKRAAKRKAAKAAKLAKG